MKVDLQLPSIHVVNVEAPAGWWIRSLRGPPVDDRPTSKLQKTTNEMESHSTTGELCLWGGGVTQALVLSMTLNCLGNVASFSVTLLQATI